MNGLNKLWHIHSTECYSATKGNELWTQATISTNLHRHYVEQRKSDTKEHTLYDSIYTSSRTGNTNLWWQKIRMVAASDLGGDWEGTQGNSLGNKNILCLESGMGFTGVHICQNSSNCTLKIYAFYFLWIKPQHWYKYTCGIASWSVSLCWSLGREPASMNQLRIGLVIVKDLPPAGSSSAPPGGVPALQLPHCDPKAVLMECWSGWSWLTRGNLGKPQTWGTPLLRQKWPALQSEIWGSNPSSRLPSNLRILWPWLNHLSALKPNAPERQVAFIFASSVPGTYMSTEWTTAQCWDRKAVLHTCKVKV